MKPYIIILLGTILLLSCEVKESEAEKLGVFQTGKESELNGTWRGKVYDGLANYTVVLKDGKIIERWISGYGLSFHGSSDEGYIGYYSFDGEKFVGATNSDKMEGILKGAKISGTFHEDETTAFHLSK